MASWDEGASRSARRLGGRFASRLVIAVAVAVILSALRAAGAFGAELELGHVTWTDGARTVTTGSTTTLLTTSPEIELAAGETVIVEFYSPRWFSSVNGATIWLELFQSGFSLGNVFQDYAAVSSTPQPVGRVSRRYTSASACSCTFSIVAATSAGTSTVWGGAGSGASSYAPAYLRVTRADPEYATPADLAAVDANGCGGLGNPCMIEASGSTADRLDLTWWGTWAIVGLMFALILAPRWFAAFRVTHGG